MSGERNHPFADLPVRAHAPAPTRHVGSTDLRLASARSVPLPTPDEVAALAANRESRHVHALLTRVPRIDWPRYATPAVLLEAIRGGLALVRSLPPDAVAAQDRERDVLEAALRLLVATTRDDGAVPRELVLAGLAWINELVRISRLDAAAHWCATLESLGAVGFPDLHPRLILAWAGVLSARGRLEEADRLLRRCYGRPDLIADRAVVPQLVGALGTTAVHLGRAEAFTRLLFDGLQAYFPGIGARRAIVVSLVRAHRGILRLLGRADVSPFDRLVVLLHWLILVAAGRLTGPALARPLERGLLAVTYALHHRRPPNRPRPPSLPAFPPQRAALRAVPTEATPVLVTRAMGGIGDLLMMTPGLRALRSLRGRAVRLAIPRRYFALFDGNDDVELVDIHGDLDPRAHHRWINLTDCPAARVESRTAPRVRRNRIEIFARALGVRGAALRAMDRRPRYVVSADERAWRDRFFAARGLGGATVVGVQLRADEPYRTPPHLTAVVAALARRWPVLVFDTRGIAGCDLPGVVKIEGASMRAAFALASGCRALVAPDSAFVHASAALDVPSVALFGPTDGRVRASDYPRCRVVDVRRTLRCVPCWRNEEATCALTGGRASVCLAAIDVAAVVAAVEEALR